MENDMSREEMGNCWRAVDFYYIPRASAIARELLQS
jgi:hypothetical protein